MKKLLAGLIALCLLSFSFSSQARSSKPRTAGLMGLGQFQLIDSNVEFDFGLGGGAFFDYRFNQRFSTTIDVWMTHHNGSGTSNGDDGMNLWGIPTFTLKYYLMPNEDSKFDPYVGMGIGLFMLSEGDIDNDSGGIGIGAQAELGLDYYFNDTISAGFSTIFRSAGLITGADNDDDKSVAVIPMALVLKVGVHF